MSQKRLVLFNQFKVYVVIWGPVTEITIGLLELSMVVVSSQINNTHLINWLHNLLILKTIYQILERVLSNTGLCPDGRHQILRIKMARKVSYTHQIITKLCHKNIQKFQLERSCIYLKILDFWLFFNTSAIFPILVIDFQIPCHLSPSRSKLVYGLGTSLLATMINDIGTPPELRNLDSIYETFSLMFIH